jgi:hypothetical protein
MTKLILLPDGNAISTAVIKSVFYYVGKGVMCRDAQQRTVSYIKISVDEHGHRIRDLLIKAVLDGSGATQPDWSFLTETSD